MAGRFPGAGEPATEGLSPDACRTVRAHHFGASGSDEKLILRLYSLIPAVPPTVRDRRRRTEQGDDESSPDMKEAVQRRRDEFCEDVRYSSRSDAHHASFADEHGADG